MCKVHKVSPRADCHRGRQGKGICIQVSVGGLSFDGAKGRALNLEDFRQTIQSSGPDDWRVIKHQGPSYQNWFDGSLTSDGYHIEVNSHYATASYKPDIDITIAWGMGLDFEHVGDASHARRFEWSKVFSDKTVRLCFADFFWRGALVDRFNYVVADGGKAVLPWALEIRGLATTQHEYDTAKLIHHLGDHVEGFEEYFRRVGFTIEGR